MFTMHLAILYNKMTSPKIDTIHTKHLSANNCTRKENTGIQRHIHLHRVVIHWYLHCALPRELPTVCLSRQQLDQEFLSSSSSSLFRTFLLPPTHVQVHRREGGFDD